MRIWTPYDDMQLARYFEQHRLEDVQHTLGPPEPQDDDPCAGCEALDDDVRRLVEVCQERDVARVRARAWFRVAIFLFGLLIIDLAGRWF